MDFGWRPSENPRRLNSVPGPSKTVLLVLPPPRWSGMKVFGDSRRFHQICKETDSEQESEDSSDSDGDKEVCKVNKSVREASYLYALSRVQESAERKHSLRQRHKEAQTSGRVWTEDVGDFVEEMGFAGLSSWPPAFGHGGHRKLHQALHNRYKDLVDLDLQKEWVDPKAHILWEADYEDPKRWRMDQHSLDEADDQCAKVWIQSLNDLTVQKFVDNLTRLQDEWSQEGLISYLKSLTVEVDSQRLQWHFRAVMKHRGSTEWSLRVLEGPASTLVMRLPWMATTGISGGGGIPLEEYRKDVPPGWDPAQSATYPLKVYMDRVRMWYRLWDGLDESVGPMLAGRLRGRAQSIALQIRLPTPNGDIDVGDAALIRLSVDEVRDPNTNEIIQHPQPSGVQALMTALRSAFGEAEQLQATKSLETFFEFKRGRLSLAEWSVQWQLNYEEAAAHAGLEINNVAKTYLYFKSSNLSQKSMDDLLLQVHGDMRRFEEVRTLLLRMAHRSLDHQGGASNLFEENKQYYMDDDYESNWSGDSWQDAGAWNEAHYMADELYAWYEQDWNEGAWDSYYKDDTENWEEQTWYESGWNENGDDEVEINEHVADDTQDFFKGKSKGGRPSAMGLGCSTCGSKWHNTHSCPLGSEQRFGKGKGFGKSKGFGKGKYPRKGFGKKGYGKKGSYYPRKGFGKKGFWSEEMPAGYSDFYGGSYLSNTNAPLIQDKSKVIQNVFTETPKNATRIIAEDSPDREEFLGKKVRFDDKPPEQADGDGASTVQSKKLNFPEMQADSMDAFHMVRGKRIPGLLVDPGAASGLVGTDTLRELM
eukprot:s3364_g4.t1